MRVLNVVVSGSGPHGVAIEPSGRQPFVTNVWSGDVAVVDLTARRVVDRIPVGVQPNGISFTTRTQAHARGAANMSSPLVRPLPLGGRLDGGSTGGNVGHQH
jgi:YVTN family beta-propeller protein